MFQPAPSHGLLPEGDSLGFLRVVPASFNIVCGLIAASCPPGVGATKRTKLVIVLRIASLPCLMIWFDLPRCFGRLPRVFCPRGRRSNSMSTEICVATGPTLRERCLMNEASRADSRADSRVDSRAPCLCVASTRLAASRWPRQPRIAPTSSM